MLRKCYFFILFSFIVCLVGCEETPNKNKVLESIVLDHPQIVVSASRPEEAETVFSMAPPLQSSPQLDLEAYREIQNGEDIKINLEAHQVSFWVKVNGDALENGFNGILYNKKDGNSNGLISLLMTEVKVKELALALLAVEGRTSGFKKTDSGNQYDKGSEILISLQSLEDENSINIEDLAAEIKAPWKPIYVMGISNYYMEPDASMDFIGFDMGTPSLIVPSDYFDVFEFFKEAMVSRCCTVKAGHDLKTGVTYLLTLTVEP